MKKALSLALSATMTLSSLAALQLTAAAADDSISLGGEREFDAVRITYADNAQAPEGTKLTVNGTEYDLTAGETSQVINVQENTKASDIKLTGYSESNPEIKLLEYDRIEMTTFADSVAKPYTKPYLAQAWSGNAETGTPDNQGNIIMGRFEGLFDGTYTDGTLIAKNKDSALYSRAKDVSDVDTANPTIPNSDESECSYTINFDFVSSLEIAKVKMLMANSLQSGYTISLINDIATKEIGTELKKVSKEDIIENETVGNDTRKKTETVINSSTQFLQIKFDDFMKSANYDKNSQKWQSYISISEIIFYTYKDIYTVGTETYMLALTDVPSTFNAVRLTYDEAKTFTGQAQFYAGDTLVGDPQPVSFNNTTTGAAVFDTATIANKNTTGIDRVAITMPTGIGAPEVGAYLKYKRLVVGTDIQKPEIYTFKGYENLTDGEQIRAAWTQGHVLFDNLFDAEYNEDGSLKDTKANCGWYHNASQQKGNENANLPDPEGIYIVYIPLNNQPEIAKLAFMVATNYHTAYQLTTISNHKKITSEKISADAVKNNNNTADLLVNSTADELDVKLSDFPSNTGMTTIRELLFYGYEEIIQEVPTPVAATYDNTYVATITSADNESIKEETSATAVLSTIKSNDQEIKGITWTWNGITNESTTKIQPNSTVLFGLILSDNVDENSDFNEIIETKITVE